MRAAWLAGAVCFLALGSAFAQPVYRCGADGRTYSHTPCAEGRVIDADDSRSESQRSEAARQAAADKRQTDEMAQERRRREASVKASAEKRPAPASKVHQAKGKIRTIQVKSKARPKADAKG